MGANFISLLGGYPVHRCRITLLARGAVGAIIYGFDPNVNLELVLLGFSFGSSLHTDDGLLVAV